MQNDDDIINYDGQAELIEYQIQSINNEIDYEDLLHSIGYVVELDKFNEYVVYDINNDESGEYVAIYGSLKAAYLDMNERHLIRKQYSNYKHYQFDN